MSGVPAEAVHAVRRGGWDVIAVHSVDADGACLCGRGSACPSPGKHPVGRGWASAPPLSGADVEETWDQTSVPRNVGGRTGRGIVVVDLDGPDGQQWRQDNAHRLPATREHRTGSGGTHLVFRLPEGVELPNSARMLGPGVDTRANGGMVVLPPSVSGAGAYSVVSDAEVAQAPDWLVELLRSKPRTAPPAVPVDCVDLSPEEQARADRYAESARAGELERLAECQRLATPDGRGYTGRPWDATTHAVACNLTELANSGWTAYSHDDVESDVLAHAPRDSGFGRAEHAAKLASARATVGSKARGLPASRHPDGTLEGLLHPSSPHLVAVRPQDGAEVTTDHASSGQHPSTAPGVVDVTGESSGRRQVVLRPASSFRLRRVRWLWDGRLALGTLGLLAGPEGLGKSSLGYWLAARITRGELPGEHFGQPRSVLVSATEDSWEHTIVPRLMAAGADLKRVWAVEVMSADGVAVGLSLPRDVVATEREAREVDASLLLLDPLMSRIDAGLDTHRDSEVRRALEPLVALADRADLAVLGLIHHNKSGSADPMGAVMASKAFTAVARSVHTVVRDPDDDTETRRLFGTPKNNLGRGGLPTLAFTIATHVLETEDGPASTGRLEWAGEVEGTIREAMGRAALHEGDRSATAEAADWLHHFLESNGGQAPKADVIKAAHAAGHSPEAVRRARERLRLEHRREGFPSVTIWALPTSGRASRGGSPWGESTTDMTDTTGADLR